ncbi:MAG: type II secretion system protein GspG [Bdellovibrionales bacterium]|nr:type II secretion system protein GspG [Bdellovibrionales bacterium]
MRIPKNEHPNSQGFTLIEVLMVVGLIAILALASMDMLADYVDESRYQETIAKLEQLKVALVGDPAIRNQGIRTSFGIFGDLGGLPAAPTPGLGALISNSSYPAFAPDNGVRLSFGWSGPYLTLPNPGASVDTDAWGTAIQYDTSGNKLTLTSYGANREPGGTGLNADIVVSVPTEALYATVSGFICDNGGPFDSEARVHLSFPDGTGGLREEGLDLGPGGNGYFRFSQVPFGVRSLIIKVTGQMIGPVLITVDSPNFVVPCKQIDINP